MKITNFVPQAFQNLYSQFSSSWLGRFVQPIKTPLKVLFPFALLGGVFYVVSKVYSNFKPFTLVKPIEIKKLLSAAQFCQNHKMELKSPLLEKIREIEEWTKEWKETDDSTIPSTLLWCMRAHVMRKQTDSLLPLIQNKEKITQIIADLKDSEKAFVDIFKEFKKEIGFLAGLENTKQEKFIEEIEAEFQKITLPTITTFNDYLQSVVPLDRLAHYQGILPKRGVASLEDLNLLELRTWDQDLETLIAFVCAFKAHPEDPTIQAAVSKFLVLLANKINTENQKDYILNEPAPQNHISLSGAFLELIKKPFEEFPKIVKAFKALYLSKQKLQLDAYIGQYLGHLHWEHLRNSKKIMTLVELKGEASGINNFYRLDNFTPELNLIPIKRKTL